MSLIDPVTIIGTVFPIKSQLVRSYRDLTGLRANLHRLLTTLETFNGTSMGYSKGRPEGTVAKQGDCQQFPPIVVGVMVDINYYTLSWP